MSAPSIAPYFPFNRVRPVEQRVERIGSWDRAVIGFDFDPTEAPLCSGCGEPAQSLHSSCRRQVRDLPLASARVTLEVPQRKLRCPSCGIRVESHSFLAPHRRLTRRLERAVAELCRVLPIQHVASHFGLHWETVKTIDRRRLEREVGTPCYDGLRRLAIDEISVHKGHRYMTIVLDLETGRVVWMGQNRTQATLRRFFAELSTEQIESIEAVALDMSGAYHEAVRQLCPQAAIVCDLFHLVAKYGREVIDRVRVDESKKHSGPTRRYIKGSRYLLLRNAEKLSTDQRAKLDELLAVNENLSIVYLLKDQLKDLWKHRDPQTARRAFHQWCEMAENSGLAPLVTFARNLRSYEEPILNHCRYPIHTGRLEGVNNRIKVIKRQAYGFHDDDYFILKVKGTFNGQCN